MAATKRFPWILTLVVLICMAILINLGAWQLRRLAWKEDLLSRREAMLGAPAKAIGPVLAKGADPHALDMVRVEVTCAGLDRAPFESLYGLAEGKMVYRLVSPCRLENSPYDGILVDRGYVLDTVSQRPAVMPDTYPVHVIGLLTAPEAPKGLSATFTTPALPTPKPGQPKVWFGRDIAGMAKALGLQHPAPVFLTAETSSNPDWKDLHPGLPPVIIANRHLEYAWTWFGLAGALACVYAAMLWRWRKGQ